MVCNFWAVSTYFFLCEMKFSMDLARTCYRPKQRSLLCSILRAFIGLWVKLGYRNKPACSESNPVQSSISKSTTYLRESPKKTCAQAAQIPIGQHRNWRIDSLLSDLILTPSMKEYAFKTSIVSVFLYSAGLVSWSLNELLEINAMWSNAYTRFWWRRKSARGIDASPILLSNTDGGRDCPSAIEEWTREVLTLYDQCLFLPGEVACPSSTYPRRRIPAFSPIVISLCVWSMSKNRV